MIDLHIDDRKDFQRVIKRCAGGIFRENERNKTENATILRRSSERRGALAAVFGRALLPSLLVF